MYSFCVPVLKLSHNCVSYDVRNVIRDQRFDYFQKESDCNVF
jgi:hypothetical protein